MITRAPLIIIKLNNNNGFNGQRARVHPLSRPRAIAPGAFMLLFALQVNPFSLALKEELTFGVAQKQSSLDHVRTEVISGTEKFMAHRRKTSDSDQFPRSDITLLARIFVRSFAVRT